MKKILALILMLLTFAAVPSPAQAENSTIEDVMRRGTLRVGFSSFVPWAMQSKDGSYIGFEIDVATRLAKDLGVEIQLVPTSWDGIIPALLAGKFDVIIGGMGSTVKRALSVNFTVPYDYSYQDVTINKEKGAGISKPEDLNQKGMVIAARTGSTAALLAKDIFPNATLRLFNDEAPAVQEVLSGRAVAFVSSAPLPAMETLANSDKLFQPFRINTRREPISFAVKKGDIDTLNVFDTWIRSVENEGWLEARRNYWFRSNDWQAQVK